MQLLLTCQDVCENVISPNHGLVVGTLLILEVAPCIEVRVIAPGNQLPLCPLPAGVCVLGTGCLTALLLELRNPLPTRKHLRLKVDALVIAVGLLGLGLIVQGLGKAIVLFACKVLHSHDPICHSLQGSLKGILLSGEVDTLGRWGLLPALYNGLPIVPTPDTCRACKEGSLKLLLQGLLCSCFLRAQGSRCPAGSLAPGYLLEL